MVAFIDRSTRVGRSQGASIFWGVVSVCFDGAACFYYLKNHDNERAADQMRDQVLKLQEENESLSSQKDHLQASAGEAESQLKTREDLVEQKETELAEEEAHLESIGQQAKIPTQQNQAEVTVIKKFNDLIRKLGKDGAPDVVERGGRPVLRVPNAQLFTPGDVVLKPEGKALLKQIAQALNGQIDNSELRVVSYTNSGAEADAAGAAKKDASAKTPYATAWDLTAARATAISRYFIDQSSLPSANILVMGRGDSSPINSGAKDSHARDCRVEITVTPLPAPFHAPDLDLDKVASKPAVDPLAPPLDPPAPHKDKPKNSSP